MELIMNMTSNCITGGNTSNVAKSNYIKIELHRTEQ